MKCSQIYEVLEVECPYCGDHQGYDGDRCIEQHDVICDSCGEMFIAYGPDYSATDCCEDKE